MEITDVKIRKTFENQPLRAILSVVFDNCLAVHDVKIIYARDKYFVVMPSKKSPDGSFKDIIHPINSSFREELEKALVNEYLSNEEAPYKESFAK
ncbi:MAG: SpoVG family protein [Clostridia bacterium]|nr:SpoVG family protein [Clostridia bacterium]